MLLYCRIRGVENSLIVVRACEAIMLAGRHLCKSVCRMDGGLSPCSRAEAFQKQTNSGIKKNSNKMPIFCEIPALTKRGMSLRKRLNVFSFVSHNVLYLAQNKDTSV